MLHKYIVCKPNSVGKTEYWNGSSSVNNAWSASVAGAKPFDTEDSAMKAFCGGTKFSGKVSEGFAQATSAACRLQGAVEISILKIVTEPVKKFTISARNFPL